MKITNFSAIIGLYIKIRLDVASKSVDDLSNYLYMKRPLLLNRLNGETLFKNEELVPILSFFNITYQLYLVELNHLQSIVIAHGITISNGVIVLQNFLAKKTGNKTVIKSITDKFNATVFKNSF